MSEIQGTAQFGVLETQVSDEAGRLAALRRYQSLDAEPESDFDEITALLTSILGTSMAAISLIDSDRQWFKSRVGPLPASTSRSVAFCDHTIRTADVLAVPDARQDSRFDAASAAGMLCYLGAPLTTPDGYNIGTLCVADIEPRHFTQSETDLLRRFARLVIKQMELRQIASRDGLTGVLTRRAFEEHVTKELARHKRHGENAVLAVFDLDRFKAINDTYGHPLGDAVLKATVDACAEGLRTADCLGRLGGEEFGILLAGTGAYEATGALRRLRALIEAAVVPGYPHIPFTASFGAAPSSVRYHGITEWFTEVDCRLYMAKRAGRNCCVIQPDAAPVI